MPDYLDVTDTASISTKADIFTSESLSSSSCKNPTTGLAVNIMKRNIQLIKRKLHSIICTGKT